jgi:hypothetical protein
MKFPVIHTFLRIVLTFPEVGCIYNHSHTLQNYSQGEIPNVP